MEIIGWALLTLVGLGLLCMVFFLFIQRRFNGKVPYQQPKQFLQPNQWSSDKVTVGWVGHSTILINLFGYRILTDPVFGKKAGVSLGFTQVGIPRHMAPALKLEDIGPVDLILLSHGHMDHFDTPSLKKLANANTKVITATGTSGLLKRLPFGEIFELGGRDSLTIDEDVTIQAVPVKHWGNRFPWNHSYGYTGYLIERNNTRIFFPGDTAYTPDFRWLREVGEIDIAFMPIGAYSPDAFQRHHCTPEQAWKMFLDTGAKQLIPIHWNTFVLSQEPVEEPLERLLEAAGEEKDRIVLTEQGQIFTLQSNPILASS
ncbi:MBL fold metallo-hydrolase [Shimazuella kribbensis]|uniref:MBL fold metallo-hydrolase n=1 Tax=Shimazuella kribbensis TaxID=139808 RepID=UPI000423DDA2|nr:MBL fold metallo-hydrolase [Shimazuella kribbensis]